MLLDRPGASYYQCTFDEADHINLAEILKSISGKFILSYDDHEMVRELYKDLNIREVDSVRYSMNNKPGTANRHCGELIITNF
jgi:DNA adenine methylase